MYELMLLILGAVLGVAATEAYTHGRQRVTTWSQARFAKRFQEESDPVRHAETIREIFLANDRGGLMFRPTTASDTSVIPMLHDQTERFVGPIEPHSDWPVEVVGEQRVTFAYDQVVIDKKRKAGLDLWDGSILYSRGAGETDQAMPVGVCNYFGYVAHGDRVLRESDNSFGDKPLLLGAFHSFDQALSGVAAPVVLAVAATCVFETGTGRVTAVQRRSSQVVNARGLIGVAPIFGLEPNTLSGEQSEFGLVTYNLLKEILEEFFDESEVQHATDRPGAAHPDWVFRTANGQELVNELRSGRVTLRCTGAAIDLSDGSLIFSVLAPFTSPEYLGRLKLHARGSWESDGSLGSRIEFKPVNGSELTSLMSTRTMIASSIFSLDHARVAMSQ